jgi:hypothetical protein
VTVSPAYCWLQLFCSSSVYGEGNVQVVIETVAVALSATRTPSNFPNDEGSVKVSLMYCTRETVYE